MINKRNIITISISLLVLLFINLFSDVKVEYLTMSLTEYRNFSLNCGTVYDILVNRVEYTDKALRMNQAVCFNNAVLRVFNTVFGTIFILLSLWIGIRYIRNRSEREDITDLLTILKLRNKS